MLHASSASVCRPASVRARRPSPMIDLYRKTAFSTRACRWYPDAFFHRRRPSIFTRVIVRSRALDRSLRWPRKLSQTPSPGGQCQPPRTGERRSGADYMPEAVLGVPGLGGACGACLPHPPFAPRLPFTQVRGETVPARVPSLRVGLRWDPAGAPQPRPPSPRRSRGRRGRFHDVEARFSTVVTPGLGARHPVDRVHRSSVVGRPNPSFRPRSHDQQRLAQAPVR